MSNSAELQDLRVNAWGTTFNSAGERIRYTEKLVETLKQMAFPKFEEEVHSSGRIYEPFTFVHDENQNSFVSIQQVPPGISVYNTDYWIRWEVKDDIYQVVISRLENLENSTIDQLNHMKDLIDKKSAIVEDTTLIITI